MCDMSRSGNAQSTSRAHGRAGIWHALCAWLPRSLGQLSRPWPLLGFYDDSQADPAAGTMCHGLAYLRAVQDRRERQIPFTACGMPRPGFLLILG